MIRNAQPAPCRPRLGRCTAPPWDVDPAPQQEGIGFGPKPGRPRGERSRWQGSGGDGKAGPCPLRTHSRQDSPSHFYVPMCEGVPRLCPRCHSPSGTAWDPTEGTPCTQKPLRPLERAAGKGKGKEEAKRDLCVPTTPSSSSATRTCPSHQERSLLPPLLVAPCPAPWDGPASRSPGAAPTPQVSVLLQ